MVSSGRLTIATLPSLPLGGGWRRAEDVGAEVVAGSSVPTLNSQRIFGGYGPRSVNPLPDQSRRRLNAPAKLGLATNLRHQIANRLYAHGRTIASLSIKVNSFANRADERQGIASLYA